MYKISNDEMLKFFQSHNEVKFFYTCCDILNAGREGYGIKKVEFYTPEENKPSLEYVEFIDNLFDESVVYINTDSDNLIEAACEKILGIYDLYKIIRISTPNINLIKNDIILKYFNISDVNKIEFGVYALLSNMKLPDLNIPENAEISLASPKNKEAIKNLDNNEWDRLPQSLHNMQEKDLLILLHKNNILAGYLHANSLYKNFYDIANVFAHENFRGNGFGVLLTVYYARYCLDNKFIPHYGSAISKYSENVAIKSGFEETSRSHFFTVAIK